MDIADVPRVVVAGHDDERVARDPLEVVPRAGELLLEAVRRQVAGADHDVGVEIVDLGDRALHQIGHEMRVAAVDVGQMGERELHGSETLEGEGGRSRIRRRCYPGRR